MALSVCRPRIQIARSNTQNLRGKQTVNQRGIRYMKIKEFPGKTLGHFPQYCHYCGFYLGLAAVML